jgi:hypothetical protein
MLYIDPPPAAAARSCGGAVWTGAGGEGLLLSRMLHARIVCSVGAAGAVAKGV